MEKYGNTLRPNAVDSTTPVAEQALGARPQSKPDAGGDVAAIAAATSADPGRAASGWADGVKAQIRENPLTIVGIVAAIAYVWGVTR